MNLNSKFYDFRIKNVITENSILKTAKIGEKTIAELFEFANLLPSRFFETNFFLPPVDFIIKLC